MRRRLLVASVRRLLADDERPVEVVYLWRHRAAMVPVVVAAAVATYVILAMVEFGSVGSRVGVSMAVGLVASVLWTDHRVLASTTAPRLVLFRAGRVRQVAVEPLREMSPTTEIVAVGSNLLLTEWLVDGERYTVPKRSQGAMTRVAAR